jgi:hypothetical protein
VVEVPKPRCTHARRFFYLYFGHFTVASKSPPPSMAQFEEGGCEFVSAFHTNRSHHPTGPNTMLKLHAGVSKKVGLPGFSSASASCTIKAELDSSLLNDTEGFQIVVQRAYQSCEQAVQDQIARLTSDGPETSQPQEIVEVRASPAIQGARITTNGAEQPVTNSAVFRDQPNPCPATASQVRAIRAICSRRKIDLLSLLRERFGLTTADELGIRQASNLIDELKSDEPTTAGSNGNGAYAAAGGAR